MRFAGSGSKLNLSDFSFSGRGGQGVGAAGGMATGAQAFQAVRSRSPKYGSMAKTSVAAQGAKRRAVMSAKASVHQTGMAAQAKVKAAEIQAKAYKAAAQKRSQGAMMGSALGAIGSIGAALLSDEKTKDCITELKDGLSILRELKPVSFYYNDQYSDEPWRLHYGFVAQEYGRTMPYHIYKDTENDVLKINTNELIAVLVQSIQELEQRLEALEK